MANLYAILSPAIGNRGSWYVYVTDLALGSDYRTLGSHTFPRGMRPPSITVRNKRLAELGFAPSPGSSWKWHEFENDAMLQLADGHLSNLQADMVVVALAPAEGLLLQASWSEVAHA